MLSLHIVGCFRKLVFYNSANEHPAASVARLCKSGRNFLATEPEGLGVGRSGLSCPCLVSEM